MANWKLTPVSMGANLVGISPEWTSGTGCYRVKRFSNNVPFFLHGGVNVIANASNILRWNSKINEESDVSVLFECGGRLVHLFNGQAFVVEFFRRLWGKTAVSRSLMFVERSALSRYSYDYCNVADLTAITTLFNLAADGCQNQLTKNIHAALVFFDVCRSYRKDISGGLGSVVSAEALVELSSLRLESHQCNGSNIPKLRRLIRTPKQAPEFALPKVKERPRADFHALKRENHARTRSVMTPSELELIKSARHLTKQEREQYFDAGSCVLEASSGDYDIQVLPFGNCYLVELDSKHCARTDGLVFRTLHDCKKAIRLLKNDQGHKRFVCGKINLESGERAVSVLAECGEQVIDFFYEHWASTTIAFNTYIAHAEPENTVSSLSVLSRLAEINHQYSIRPSSAFAAM